MKAKQVGEIKALIQSAEFQNWFQSYNQLREDLLHGKERLYDLLAQANMVAFKADTTQRRADETVFRAGEYEDLAAQAHAEFAAIENESYEMLSAFEEQRQLVTEYWMLAQRASKLVEDERQKADELRAKLDAARKSGGGQPSIDSNQLQAIESRVAAFAKEAEQTRAKLDTLENRREELWTQVESAWSSSFRANMARTEFAYKAQRTRGDGEELFNRATAERVRVGELEAAAAAMDEKIKGLEQEFLILLESAERDFECTLIEDFLYWTEHENVDWAVCVPLIEERRHLNIQVGPLQLYRAARARGLEFLEPLSDTNDADSDDPRLDSFFIEGRPS